MQKAVYVLIHDCVTDWLKTISPSYIDNKIVNVSTEIFDVHELLNELVNFVSMCDLKVLLRLSPKTSFEWRNKHGEICEHKIIYTFDHAFIHSFRFRWSWLLSLRCYNIYNYTILISKWIMLKCCSNFFSIRLIFNLKLLNSTITNHSKN